MIIIMESSGNPSISDRVIYVPEVVISASRNEHFGTGNMTEIYTGKILVSGSGESLGNFLSRNSAINIKSYGAGGALANISLRGTSASHVQVNWNGFPINSVTNGSYDFSMIPAAGFDRVSVVYGASGALYGSGTFGGAVNLDNNKSSASDALISVNAGYESLKTIKGNVSVNTGNEKISWKLNAWATQSDNEFSFYDYIKQEQRTQTDGSWNDTGILQYVFLRLSPSSTLDAGIWFQKKSYNIPSRIGSVSYELQRDSTLKMFLAYKKYSDRWGLQVKGAMFNDGQYYHQKLSENSSVYSIESAIGSKQYYGDANFRYYIKQWLSLDAGVTGNLITADVYAYGEKKKQAVLEAFAGLKYKKGRLSWQSELRKGWNNDFKSGLIPSLGISWEIKPDVWTVTANGSRKYRRPTFNDLYWVPGGNPGLKAEKGYTLETGSYVTVIDRDSYSLSAEINFYISRIRDMIVWHPTGSYWSADNYQLVNTSGTESKLVFDTEKGRVKLNSVLMITLNRSMYKTENQDEYNRMVYSPSVITSWKNRISYRILDLSVWHNFTGDRYYDEESVLDSYHTIDIGAGVKLPVGNSKLALHLFIYNITNTVYENIRLYPMPGRYWSIKMNYEY